MPVLAVDRRKSPDSSALTNQYQGRFVGEEQQEAYRR